jgi:hypothetical protein
MGLWYNQAYLIPEGNPPGNVVCDALVQMHYPLSRLFVGAPDTKGEFRGRMYSEYGFMTDSHKAKQMALSLLHDMLYEYWMNPDADDGLWIPCPTFWEQARTFSKSGNKVEAQKGCHDDFISAGWCLAWGLQRWVPAPIDHRSYVEIHAGEPAIDRLEDAFAGNKVERYA